MKKSISSSSLRVGAMYLRCCRTKNPCSSKYSRTMASLTAAISNLGFRISDFGSLCGVGTDGLLRIRSTHRRLVEHVLHEIERDGLSEGHLADFVHQDKIDNAFADFLVVLHRLQEFFALRWVQVDVGRQPGFLEKGGNPLGILLWKSEQLG